MVKLCKGKGIEKVHPPMRSGSGDEEVKLPQQQKRSEDLLVGPSQWTSGSGGP